MDIFTLGMRADTRDLNRGKKDVQGFAAAGQRAETQVNKSTKSMGRSFGDMSGFIRAASAALVAFGAVRAVKNIARVSDEYANINSRLKLVTNSTNELASVQSSLFGIAQSTSTKFGSVAELYARTAQQADALGASQAELLSLTNLTTQAFIVSGASQQESAGAIRQLTQALSSGVLRGEEFNSVMEQGPRLMKALAAGMKRPVSELRELAQAGNLTADIVLPALLSQAEAINAEFAQMPRTVGRATTELGNAFDQALASAEVGPLVDSFDQLREVIEDPAFRESIATLGGIMVTAFSSATTAAATTASVVKFLAEEFAALVNGPAIGDMVRIEESIYNQSKLVESYTERVKALAGANGQVWAQEQLDAAQEQLGYLVSLRTTTEVLAADTIKAAGAAKTLSNETVKAAVAVVELTDAEKKNIAKTQDKINLVKEENKLLQLGYTLEDAKFIAAYANADAMTQALMRQEREQQGIVDGLQSEIDVLADVEAAQDAATAAAKEFADENQKIVDSFLNADFGSGLTEGFNDASKALASFVDGFGDLIDSQEEYNKAKEGAKDSAELAKIEAKHQKDQIGLYGDMAASAKGFFDEGSSGYKNLEKVETAFRAAEMALAIEGLAVKLGIIETETIAQVAADGIKAASSAVAAAVSSMVGLPFPLNIAALAATVAAIGALGVSVLGSGGGGGISGAQAAQESQGTGTILGDSSAKSDSAFKALELMEEHLSEGLKVSSGMLNELRTLNANIAGLGKLLGRKLDFEGGMVNADLSGGLGGAGSAYMDMIDRTTLGFGDEIDKLLGGFYSNIASTISSSRSWKDNEGLKIAGGAVADILESGAVQAMAWAVVNTKKSKLFSGTNTTSNIVSRELGEEISGQFGKVIAGIYGSVFSAVGGMGVGDISGITDFAGFEVSTMGLSSKDAQAEISAVLSEFADTIALEALPALINMQNVGEGAFETLARVSTQTLIFKDAAESLGLSLSSQASNVEQAFNQIGMAIMGGVSGLFGRSRRERPDQSDVNFRRKWSDEQILIIADTLVTAAGGIEQFASNVASFTDMVLTDAEKFARNEGYVASIFERLGEAVPASIKDLGAYVSGLDLSIASHQKAFTALTGASDLLDDYYSKLEDYSKTAYNFDTAMGLNDGRKGLREALAAVGQNFDVVETAAMGGVSALAELFGGLSDVEKSGLEPFSDAILNLIPATADASSGLVDMQRQMERLSGIAKSVRQYLDGLNFSGVTGTPEQQAQAAFAELQTLSAAAMGGDVDAAQRLTSVADQVLRLGETAFASGDQFQDLFGDVKSLLSAFASMAGVDGSFNQSNDFAAFESPARVFNSNDAASTPNGNATIAPMVNAIDGHRSETMHQTKIQAASQKQIIDQLKSISNRVAGIESEQKIARLEKS